MGYAPISKHFKEHVSLGSDQLHTDSNRFSTIPHALSARARWPNGSSVLIKMFTNYTILTTISNRLVRYSLAVLDLTQGALDRGLTTFSFLYLVST